MEIPRSVLSLFDRAPTVPPDRPQTFGTELSIDSIALSLDRVLSATGAPQEKLERLASEGMLRVFLHYQIQLSRAKFDGLFHIEPGSMGRLLERLEGAVTELGATIHALMPQSDPSELTPATLAKVYKGKMEKPRGVPNFSANIDTASLEKLDVAIPKLIDQLLVATTSLFKDPAEKLGVKLRIMDDTKIIYCEKS